MTEAERQEYVHHLEHDECAVCRSEVNELQSAISMLAFTLPSATPSARVKDRLMEQARSVAQPTSTPHPRLRWLQWATTAAAIASIAVALIVTRRNSELRQLTDELNGRIAQLEVQLAEHRNTLAMFTSPGVRVVDLAGQGANVQARGRIFWNQQQKRWFFYVRDLPAAPADKVYQLWFVPRSRNPVSAKTFNTDSNGSAEIEIPVPDEASDLKAAAVTTEPAPGVPQPTGSYALLGAM